MSCAPPNPNIVTSLLTMRWPRRVSSSCTAAGTPASLEQAAKANPRWAEPHARLAAVDRASANA